MCMSQLIGTRIELTYSVVHPLVLLSVSSVYLTFVSKQADNQVVDHAHRTQISKNKRVLGLLLGQNDGSTINVANS
jgi:hypothetical protein